MRVVVGLRRGGPVGHRCYCFAAHGIAARDQHSCAVPTACMYNR